MRSAVPTARLVAPLLAGLALALVPVPRSARAGGGPVTVVANLTQVNHVAVDDENLYWTEVQSNLNRLRCMPKGGGAITTLASETSPVAGKLITYVQIQLLGDRVYWSRLSTGGGSFWSIRSVPKTGGTPEVVLPESTGANPLSIAGWRAASGQIIATLLNPARVGLPAATRVGAYDPETKTWRSLLAGRFKKGAAFITAATNEQVFLRGITPANKTETGAATLNPLNPGYTVLRPENGVDSHADEPGATDGADLFFWSFQARKHRLRRIPINGGAPAVRLNGVLGRGLVVDGSHLYWVVRRNVFRAPVASGGATAIFNAAFETGALGGLAHDANNVYVAANPSAGKFSIVALPKP